MGWLEDLAQNVLKKPAVAPVGNDLPPNLTIGQPNWLTNLPVQVQPDTPQTLPTISTDNSLPSVQNRPAFDLGSVTQAPATGNDAPMDAPGQRMGWMNGLQNTAMQNQAGIQPTSAPVDTSWLKDLPVVNNPNSSTTLAEQIAKNINPDDGIKKDANGNITYRGADRAKTHGVKDILKGIALGALQGAGTGQGLGGIIGGAAAGGIGEGIDRNSNQHVLNSMKLPKLEQRYQFQRAQEDAQVKQQQANLAIQKGLAETKGIILDNQNKVFTLGNNAAKSDLDTLQQKDFITPEEANTFNQRYAAAGIRINPYDARKFVTRDNNGATLSTPEKGPPNYQPTQGVAVRPDEVVHNVTIGGQTLPLSAKEAAPAINSAYQAKLQREQNASQFGQRLTFDTESKNASLQQEAALANLRASQDYYKQALDLTQQKDATGNQVLTNSAAVQERVGKVQDLADRIYQMESSDTIDLQNDPAAIAKHDKLVEQLDKARDDMHSELNKTQAGQRALESLNKLQLPTPQKIQAQQIKNPMNNVGKQYASKAEYIQAAKAHGLTGDALRKAVIQGGKDGKY